MVLICPSSHLWVVVQPHFVQQQNPLQRQNPSQLHLPLHSGSVLGQSGPFIGSASPVSDMSSPILYIFVFSSLFYQPSEGLDLTFSFYKEVFSSNRRYEENNQEDLHCYRENWELRTSINSILRMRLLKLGESHFSYVYYKPSQYIVPFQFTSEFIGMISNFFHEFLNDQRSEINSKFSSCF